MKTEILYNILISYLLKLVTLIEKRLTELYSTVRKGKGSSDAFRIQGELKLLDALSAPLLSSAITSREANLLNENTKKNKGTLPDAR
jgi:hypothetical protein